MLRRVVALFCWTYLIWVLLTWTLTVEMQLFGAGFALAVAVALAPLGEVAGPWSLLRPRRLAGAARLLASAAGQVVLANLRLSWLIWHPRLRHPDGPLHSGMVIVPTRYDCAGQLAAVGVITSLIVDNQLTDLDRSRRELQYHAVVVPEGGPRQAGEQINGPVERRLAPFGRGGTEQGRPVSTVYITVAIAEVAIAVLLIGRLAAGPTVSDRIVAVNTIATQSALALLFFAAFAGRSFYPDVALWLASFSYLGAIVWSRYLERELL